jgi:hypothetical protein
LVVLAFITEAAVVLRILRHLELPTEVPATATARLDPQLELEWDVDDDDEVAVEVDVEPRGPP